MNNLIKKYIDNLSKEQVVSFALMHNIILSEDEVNFTYKFIKEHWQDVLGNYENFNIDNYKKYYSQENFIKIKELFKEYSIKFKPFLS